MWILSSEGEKVRKWIRRGSIGRDYDAVRMGKAEAKIQKVRRSEGLNLR